MKIGFVSQDFPPETGGIHRYAVELLKQFSSKHEVTALVPDQRGAEELDATLPCPVIRCLSWHTSLFGLTSFKRISALSIRAGFDVAFHTHYATALGSLFSKRKGELNHYYIAAHGRELLRENVPFLSSKLRRRILRKASGIFAVSSYTRDRVLECGAAPERVHIVPNGVDLTFFYPRPKQQARHRLGLDRNRILLSTGRLIRRKGFDTTIRAFHRIAGEFPDLIYLIIGQGPDRNRLETLARSLGSASRIRFLGQVPKADLPDYYSSADIFTMPSREEKGGSVEGFGLVFLEAGACGTAVVGSTSGGIPDAVEHEKSGLLVPPDDDVALANSLTYLLQNPDRRRSLGEQGRMRARGFNWSTTASRILSQIRRDRKEMDE